MRISRHWALKIGKTRPRTAVTQTLMHHSGPKAHRERPHVVTTRARWLTMLLLVGTGCGTSRIVNSDAVGPKGEKHLVDFYCAPQDDCRTLAKEACGGAYEIVTIGNAKSGELGKDVLVRCTDWTTHTVDKSVVGPHGEPALEFVCIEALGACIDAFRRGCQGDFNIIASNNGDWLVQCLRPPDFVPTLPAAPPPAPPDLLLSFDGGVRPTER
jgi:hypothetical protein